jgi:hydrogenase large subunit
VDPSKITESVSHSWYEYSGGDANGKHPSRARPIRSILGAQAAVRFLDVDKKYSWLKTPRYDGKPMEVGPLARMVVGYAAGKKEIKAAIDGALKKLNAPPTVLFSTLGRIAARALEAQLMAGQLEGWVDQLDDNLAHGKVAIFNPVRWDPGSWPLPPAASAGTKRRAARSAIGSRSRAKPSRTIRRWFPPPGTRDRAMRRASAAPMKRRC